MFSSIDNFLVDKVFQPVANFFHNHYNLNNYYLAIPFVVFSYVTMIVFINNLSVGPVDGFFGFVMGFVGMLFYRKGRTLQSTLDAGKLVGMNSERINPNDIFIRYMMLAFIVFGFIRVFLGDYTFPKCIPTASYTAALYFAACSTRPRIFKKKTSSVPFNNFAMNKA